MICKLQHCKTNVICAKKMEVVLEHIWKRVLDLILIAIKLIIKNVKAEISLLLTVS